jgi:hypothetical protein
MANKFFKEFKFLSQFFHRFEHEQTLIEQQLQHYFSDEEYQLAKFLDDEENISLLLIWIGKEFYKRTHKKRSLKTTIKSLNNKYRRITVLDETESTIQECRELMTSECIKFSDDTVTFNDVTRKSH